MSTRLGYGDIPESFTAEQAEFLRDVLLQIESAIDTARDLDSDVLKPVKQSDGMFRYSPGGYDFTDGPGFYGRVEGEWRLFTYLIK